MLEKFRFVSFPLRLQVLALQGEYADAIKSLKRALKLDPSNKVNVETLPSKIQ